MSHPEVAVFEIPELLELILLHLSEYKSHCFKYIANLQTTLACQRVNKTFKATIDGSKKLQEALFLRAKPTDYSAFYFVDRVTNPLLHNRDFKLDGHGSRVRLDPGNIEDTITLDYERLKVPKALPGPIRTGSWHKMYMQQPPLPCHFRWADLDEGAGRFTGKGKSRYWTPRDPQTMGQVIAFFL